MKGVLSLLIVLFALGALVAIRHPDKIKNKILRLALVLLGALSGLTVAGRSLYELSDGFNKPLADYIGVSLLVPLGWFLGSCFLVLYAFARLKVDRGNPTSTHQ